METTLKHPTDDLDMLRTTIVGLVRNDMRDPGMRQTAVFLAFLPR